MIRAFQVTNSFVSAILLAWLVGALDLWEVGEIPDSLKIALTIFFTVIKVVFYSGVLGVLGDMVLGRADYCTKAGLLAKVKRHWLFYTLLAAAVAGAYIVAGRPVFFPVFQAAADGVFLLWFARRIWKSGAADTDGARPYRISGRAAGTVVMVFLVYLGLVVMAFQDQRDLGAWTWAFLLGAKYLQLLLFAGFASTFRDERDPAGSAAGRKELILVNPIGGSWLMRIASTLVVRYAPFFVVLKALTPAGYRVREFNRRFWHGHYYRKDALVAVTCHTSDCAEAYRIARGFKRAGARVVMGGVHVSFLPEEALEFCDSVVIGPAEGVWEEVVRDYEAGTLKPVYRGSCPADKFDQVDRYLLTCPPYQVRDFLETTRGCKFACEFCVVPAWGSGVIRRSPQTVAALVSRVRPVSRTVHFIDYNMYADRAHMEAVLKAITPLQVSWTASISIDVAQDDQMLQLMKESGCRTLLIGFEIYDSSPVTGHGGKLKMAQRYIALAYKLMRQGFRIKAHFIFGFDEDTWAGLARLWLFAFRLLPHQIGSSFLLPFPGTRLHRRLVEGGRIKNLNWQHYCLYTAVFDHPRMSGGWLNAVLPVYFGLLGLTCSRQGIWLLVGLACFATALYGFLFYVDTFFPIQFLGR